MQTMYPAIVNSPLTSLVAAIDDTQNTIEVADGSKLPDAPNLATIGGGENAETVLYTGKSGNTLTGVTRGFQGIARAWPAGTQIGRFFTEYDYAAMIENIEEMSAQIGEGTPFQTTVLPGMNIITVPRSTPFNVLNIKGRTLVNLLGRLGRTATSATITIDAAKTYLIINEVGTSVTVNGINRNTPCKVTGQTSLNLSWASGSKVAVYEVSSADSAAIDGMTPEQIAQRWPYVDDVKGVRNPYIIRYGKNLLPPFTEWTLHANTKVQSSYELNHTKTTTGTYETSIFRLPAVAGQTYTIAGDIELSGTVGSSGQTATVEIYGFGKNGNYVSHVNNWINENGQSKVSYTVPSNVTHIEGRLTVNANVTGTVTFKNPMLNIGDTPLPFEPQNNDYQFFDVTLHSNTDGSVRDELFFRDGKPYKLKWFEELVLDGSLAWEFSQDKTGYKQVRIPLSNALKDSFPMAAKYDGKILKIVNPDFSLGSDEVYHHSNGYTYLSIADTDSGWSETWAGTTLTKTGSLTRDVTASDFIKAYFNGWKWDDTNKRWHLPGDMNSWSYDVDGVIRTYASTLGTPYRLLYQLAQPVEVPVSSEGEISLFEGDNLLEVGTGVVRREPANPSLTLPRYWINANRLQSSWLKNRAEKILAVYKNEIIDKSWKIWTNTTTGYGLSEAGVLTTDYDPAALYSASYIVLDKYLYTAPLIDLQGEYRTKLAGVVAELAQDQADLATRVSVVETQYARKQQGQWIAPVLLNGWVNFGAGAALVGYYKDELGNVYIKGRIKSGVATATTKLFTLPKGYRPLETLTIPLTNSDGTTRTLNIINIQSDGTVSLGMNGQNVSLDFGTIVFRAEQ